jgi:putative transposase
MRLQLLDAAGQEFPVALLRQVLDVSLYGYSAWRSRPASPLQREYLVPLAHVRSAFARSHSTYGT